MGDSKTTVRDPVPEDMVSTGALDALSPLCNTGGMSNTTDLPAVARACDHAARQPNATVEDRAAFAGTAAVLHLRQTGVVDVEQLRAASRAARAAVHTANQA